MKNVLILGAYGYLGTILSRYLISEGVRVYRQGRDESCEVCLDIFNLDSLRGCLKENKIDCIINLIAITDIEYCEKNHDAAMRVNAYSVSIIRQAIDSLSKEIRPHLIHISTDQVYSGFGPHRESQVKPVNVYGISKLAGEKYATPTKSTVLRINLIGKSYIKSRKSLSDWLVESAKNLNSIVVFEDVLFSPLHTQTICQILLVLIRNPIFGIYNLGSNSSIDKATFAYKLISILGLSSKSFVRGRLNDSSGFAPRPLDMSLNVSKIEKSLGLKLPRIDLEIYKNAKEYQHE